MAYAVIKCAWGTWFVVPPGGGGGIVVSGKKAAREFCKQRGWTPLMDGETPPADEEAV